MEIKINDSYKDALDEAEETVYRRAERIRNWRHNHPDPSESKVQELVGHYTSLGDARQKLKSAIEGYYGIEF